MGTHDTQVDTKPGSTSKSGVRVGGLDGSCNPGGGVGGLGALHASQAPRLEEVTREAITEKHLEN